MAKRDREDVALSDETSKRARLLEESSDEENENMNGHNLNINKDYAARFEHNKKREEKQRLEEKYGSMPVSDDEDESSSEDDDEGELITEDVDKGILSIIKAIKARDPRIYDNQTNFFNESDSDGVKRSESSKNEKPMRLQDYHRKTLLEGGLDEDDGEEAPKSYAQEQQELKNNIVKQMHAAGGESDAEEGEDDFLVRKSNPAATDKSGGRGKDELDIKQADKDPETFLSNFLTSNAWRSTSPSRFQPFDSDDDEELQRADEFEEAYNRRFEDPKKSNAALQSHSRDIIAKYSVRREEVTGRQKARQAEKAMKDAEKLERGEEKARLKKLKADDMERKVKLIRKSAGAHRKHFRLDEWADVLEGDFDDEQWEAEMQRRFGEEYYAEDDVEGSDVGVTGPSDKKKKIKKPKWDDDIDIKDIAPDFSDEEREDTAEHEGTTEANVEEGDDAGDVTVSDPKSKRNSKRERLKAKEEAKRTARRDRRLIENLVEQNLELGSSSSSSKRASAFRYRETSPKSFGLTARDILLASDADLNQFAGLKKLHAFRDDDKKRKDKKNLSKKARLRQWRRDTFGNEDEPEGGFEHLLGEGPSDGTLPKAAESKVQKLDSGDETKPEAKKKRKRSKKSKVTMEV